MRSIAALLLVFILAASSWTDAQATPKWLEWKIPYQGRTIRVHLIAPPKTPAPWPTAMVLHGASGVGRGHMIWPVASALAKKGVAAAIVRYYDGMPRKQRRKQSPRWFVQRERIIDHVIAQLLKRREVKGDKIGVYGYSLGGFHSIGLAATDQRIAAAVAMAGGLSGHQYGVGMNSASPLMLIHGTRDRTVPYRRSRIARSAWKKAGRPVELVTLRGVGHVPRGAVRTRSFARAADFLADHLAQSIRPPIPKARPFVPTPRPPPGSMTLAEKR